jgi:hypothetical protein
MARRLLVLFFAVLAVVALWPVGRFLTKPREVITSTPSAYTGGITPMPVPPYGSACEDQVLFDTDSQVARFGATALNGRNLDLWTVAERLLLDAGVDSVERVDLCTACHPEQFFSHRRDGPVAGRQGVIGYVA